jgi:hypothetical protein
MVDEHGGLERYLDLVRPRLPLGLVSEQAFAQARSIGTFFPELPVVGFETRLDSDEPTIDLFLLLDNCTADLEYPQRANAVHRLPSTLRSNAGWQRVIDVCQAFRSRAVPLMNLVTSIWLEFDITPDQPPLPTPSIFVGIRDLRDSSAGGDLTRRYLDSLDALIDMLTGEPPRQVLRSQLRVIVEHTAADAAGYHVGAMLSRGTHAFRICVRRTPVSRFLARAREIGWPGDPDVPRRVFGRCFQLMPDPTIHLDVGDCVGPKLGFDLALASSFLSGQPRDDSRWHELFAWLVSEGLSTPGKRDAFLAWPGGARLSRYGDDVNTSPTTNSAYLIRGLNHVKVVCDTEGALSAKGYFAYQHLEALAALTSPRT